MPVSIATRTICKGESIVTAATAYDFQVPCTVLMQTSTHCVMDRDLAVTILDLLRLPVPACDVPHLE